MIDPQQRIRKLLEETLHPTSLHIEDESWKHAGHAAAGSGGHFIVEITTEAFAGQSRIKRHRMVHEALKEIGSSIHALSIQARAPGED